MSYTDLHNDNLRPGRRTPTSRAVDEAWDEGRRNALAQGGAPEVAAFDGEMALGGTGRPGRPAPGEGAVWTTSQTPRGTVQTSGVAEQPGSDTGNRLLEKFNQRKAVAAEAEKRRLPGSKDGGKGLTGWITRNFGPGDESLAGRRRAVQNITALGQMLRHAGNLAGVSRGATPQQIQDQVAVNNALWKQEDALAYQRAQQQREYERKIAKDKADADYKIMNLALGERRQQETERNNAVNNNIAIGRYGMDSETHGWKKEDRPMEKAGKRADVDRKEAMADKAVVEAQYAEKQAKARLDLTRQNIAKAYAQAQQANASTEKTREETKKLRRDERDGYPIAGHQGKFTRKRPLDKFAAAEIIERARRNGIIDNATYNEMHYKRRGETDEEFLVRQEDAIATIVNYAGKEEIVRDIMTSHGYTYEPYAPVESKKKARLK